MSEQIRSQRRSTKRDETVDEAVDETTPTTDTEHAEQLKAETDELLDEIDSILEENVCVTFLQGGGE